jgi:pyruvate dehydrogenase E2 component (dihydrolipoamide acetyltransferase)
MAAKVFLLPDLGEGLTEAVIVRWMVSVGDTIAIDQAIAEVETAKSIVELPSPYAGVVLALHGAEGEAVETGSPVIEVGAAGDASVSHGDSALQREDRAEAEAYRSEERAGAQPAEAEAGSGNVLIGYGTGSVAAKGRRRRRGVGSLASARSAANEGAPVAVRSPIVRRLAKELGVDPRVVDATGSDGAVTRADVLQAAKHLVAANMAARAGVVPLGDEARGLHGLQLAAIEKLSPLRKAVSAKMSRSRSEIPEATVWVDVDFTELWRLRSQMAPTGERSPSVTTLVARFVLLALQEYPLLASRLSEDCTELMSFDGVNLGIAVDSERGLSVPVLPQAGALSIAELDAALRKLSAEARTGRLAPAQLSGSTFTLNNYGGFGVDGSAAIINHPEVAILGMGRVIEKPWVVGGEIVVRRIAQLSLAFDHRVCDGGYAAGFLGSLIEKIEHPLRVFSRL